MPLAEEAWSQGPSLVEADGSFFDEANQIRSLITGDDGSHRVHRICISLRQRRVLQRDVHYALASWNRRWFRFQWDYADWRREHQSTLSDSREGRRQRDKQRAKAQRAARKKNRPTQRRR